MAAGFLPFATAGLEAAQPLMTPRPGGPQVAQPESGRSPTVISVGGLGSPPESTVDMLGAAERFAGDGFIDTSRPAQQMGFFSGDMGKQVLIFIAAGLGTAVLVKLLGVRK